ncbi:hypothetical protein Tsubulata_044157 [Turnera subulata]|uniref:Uncharacterized protein n=1 Tax=Turnera subulata TaxID=218843 RepID=A0A9Q0J7W1_9ROSI|nr:hypothetical protein Tsubulata_044157 [Turnera subulata]
MKASLKFREEQKPLFRAKVPLNILGLPFQSGIVAGESKELTLNLATFFESGPSIKLAYRPNDSWNPFSLVVKTGTGPFGSPVSSSMLMSAEFNLLGNGNPTFMLHFKPQFGDFSIKKSQSSSPWDLNFNPAAAKPASAAGFRNGSVSDDDDGSSIEVVEAPLPPPPPPQLNGGGLGAGSYYGKRIAAFPPPTVNAIAGVFSGVEVAAKTRLPVRSRAVVNFRWGVRVPAEVKGGGDSGGVNFRKIPFLVMNKIGIEHVEVKEDPKSKEKENPDSARGDAVAEACMTVKRQLETLQAENGMLKKAVDDLRQDIATVDFGSGKYREIERNGFRSGGAAAGRTERRGGNDKKSSTMEADVNEELKKALKGGAGGGSVGA